MAASSSTSSSERPRTFLQPPPNADDGPLEVVRQSRRGRGGMPAALLGAIAILVGVELALRVTGWPRVMPYDMGRMEYYVAAAELNRVGPADVSIVGSSRTRESLNLPNLQAMLDQASDQPISVASYACSGAHTSDFEAVTRRLLREKVKPRLILCGVSERDLVVDSPPWDEVPTFWNVSDWLESYHQRGRVVLNDLPTVIRNEIGRYWRTLGERQIIRFRLGELARGDFERDEPSPALGGLTIWQRSSPARTLLKSPVKKSRILERARKLKKSKFPDDELQQSLVDMAAACQQAGVPLVFYEVHTSKALHDALPRGLYRKFTDDINDVAQQYGARFVRLGDLGLTLDDNDMREPSHMSYRGSEKLTAALGEKVIGPMLGLKIEPPPKPKKAKKPKPRR